MDDNLNRDSDGNPVSIKNPASSKEASKAFYDNLTMKGHAHRGVDDDQEPVDPETVLENALPADDGGE